MELGLRITLWMFLLSGCLQAKPVTRVKCNNHGDLGLCYLSEEVSCANMNFTSPINVQDSCYNAALQSFENGLKQAMEARNCTDVNQRIGRTLEALERVDVQVDASSNCTMETRESQFEDFVKDMGVFVGLVTAHQNM